MIKKINHLTRTKILKPWGYYEDITRNSTRVEKILFINKNEEISWQFHNFRKERWKILEGSGTLVRADDINSPVMYCKVFTGDEFEIKEGELHQVIADMGTPIKIHEIQTGTCDETDIVRVRDKYLRESD